MITNIPEEILQYAKKTYGDVFSFKPASGGCINHGGLLETQQGRLFIKWNSAELYPEMFAAEAKGLELLASAKAITIPEVWSVFEGENQSCLVLEHIESSTPAQNFWEHFGVRLANLHRNSTQLYGLDHDNYMGSLKQFNNKKEDLVSFFIDYRLQPQIDLAKGSNKIDIQGLELFDKLYKKLPDILIEEKPALVHGDLWSGNFMVGNDGEAVLIDPAVAYGHREMDLAMTRLFGGFNQAFYEAYHENFPLAPGFEERLNIYNLYPLMVHVNLFGGGYYQQVLSILNKYH